MLPRLLLRGPPPARFPRSIGRYSTAWASSEKADNDTPSPSSSSRREGGTNASYAGKKRHRPPSSTHASSSSSPAAAVTMNGGSSSSSSLHGRQQGHDAEVSPPPGSWRGNSPPMVVAPRNQHDSSTTFYRNDPNQVVLARCLDQGRLPDAVDALERMGAAGVHLDLPSAMRLINACNRVKSWDLIESVVR